MRIRKTPPKEFTIVRSKWAHGGTQNERILGPTNLLNDKGNMCCLGFYAEACGAPKTYLRGRAYPGSEIPLMQTIGLCGDAIRVNDRGGDNKAIEKELKVIFKSRGVKVKFVGRYLKGVV